MTRRLAAPPRTLLVVARLVLATLGFLAVFFTAAVVLYLVGLTLVGVGGGQLTLQAPPHANVAPPGYYMLFVLNTAGVPSTAAFVQLS